MTAAGTGLPPGTPRTPSLSSPWSDPLDALWRALSSLVLSQILLGMMALFLMIGMFVPQMPADIEADPAGFAGWLSELPEAWRPHMGWLETLGLTSVYGGTVLRVLLALTGLSLFVTLFGQVRMIWEFFFGTALSFGVLNEKHSRHFASGSSEAQHAGTRVRLIDRRYLVSSRENASGYELRALRWPASALSHLGALVLLTGLALNAIAGWQLKDLALPPDKPHDTGRSGLTILFRDPDHVALLRDGRTLASGNVSPHQTFRYGTTSLVYRARGPLAVVSGTSAAGASLLLDALPRRTGPEESIFLAFTEQRERSFYSQGSGNAFLLTLLDDGFLVDAYPRGQSEPALSERFDFAAGTQMYEIDFGGEKYHLLWRQYAVLDVRRDPAFPMMAGGALLTLTGLGLRLICRPGYSVWRFLDQGKGARVDLELDGSGDRSAVEFLTSDVLCSPSRMKVLSDEDSEDGA